MPVAGGVRHPRLPIAVAVRRRDVLGLLILADTAYPVLAPRCGVGGLLVGDPLAELVGLLAESIAAALLFAGMPVVGTDWSTITASRPGEYYHVYTRYPD